MTISTVRGGIYLTDDIDRCGEPGQGLHRPDDDGCPVHRRLVVRHVGDVSVRGDAGLEADTSGVEGDTLADEDHRPVSLRPSAVIDLQEVRGLAGTLSHVQEGEHPLVLDPLHIAHVDVDAARTQDSYRLLSPGSA